MAAIKNFMLQGLSGRVGDIVYRTRNGKTYASSRPQYSKSNDPGTLRRRDKFALTVKLAKCINSIPELKHFWNKVRNSNMSTHNMITKSNYDCVTHDEIVSVPKLTPDSFPLNGFGDKFKYSQNNISIEYSPKEYPFVSDSDKEIYLKVVGINHVSQPHNAEEHYNSFFAVSSDYYSMSDDNNISINIPIDDCNMMYIDSYSECTLFLAFVSADKNHIPVNSVSSFKVVIKSAIP